MMSPGLSRRRFLIGAGGVSAVAVLAGCSSAAPGRSSMVEDALPGERIGAGSPRILAAELARQRPGQRTDEVALDAVAGPIESAPARSRPGPLAASSLRPARHPS